MARTTVPHVLAVASSSALEIADLQTAFARCWRTDAAGCSRPPWRRALSSDFVFQPGGSAYCWYGGSPSRGMALGSSHYLMSEIPSRLQSDGLRAINLDQARFKEDFGARLAHVERLLVKQDRGPK